MRLRLITAFCCLLGFLFVAAADLPSVGDVGLVDVNTPPPAQEVSAVLPAFAAGSEPVRAEILATVTPIPITAVASVTPPTPVPFTRTPRLKTATATVAPAPNVNGVPIARIVVMSQAVREHIRQIFAQGQTLGRNPRAFSKVGDSTMVYPPFLAAFDSRTYRLGTYGALQVTVDRFAGSFARESIAARKGMHTWSEFDPGWVNSSRCEGNEGPLACELRVNDPSIALIRLGANDSYAPQDFNTQLRHIVATCLANGIIPVLGTKPDRIEGRSNTLNQMIAQVASAYTVPLWDYDLIAATVPGKGLEKDGVHFVGTPSRDYSSGQTLKNADALEDLTGLMVLDAIRAVLGD